MSFRPRLHVCCDGSVQSCHHVDGTPHHREVHLSLLHCCCRFREKAAMQEATEEFKDIIDRFIALQFLFDKQWKAVKVGNTC